MEALMYKTWQCSFQVHGLIYYPKLPLTGVNTYWAFPMSQTFFLGLPRNQLMDSHDFFSMKGNFRDEETEEQRG